jgi:hypothetical protein
MLKASCALTPANAPGIAQQTRPYHVEERSILQAEDCGSTSASLVNRKSLLIIRCFPFINYSGRSSDILRNFITND